MVDSVVGYTYAVRMALVGRGAYEYDRLTEAEHDVEEDDQYHRNSIDGIARGTHPKWALGNVLATSEQMGSDGQGVGYRCEDDEGAYKVGECSFAAELDRAKTGA